MVRDYYRHRLLRFEYAGSGGLSLNENEYPEEFLVRILHSATDIIFFVTFSHESCSHAYSSIILRLLTYIFLIFSTLSLLFFVLALTS